LKLKWEIYSTYRIRPRPLAGTRSRDWTIIQTISSSLMSVQLLYFFLTWQTGFFYIFYSKASHFPSNWRQSISNRLASYISLFLEKMLSVA
jgi:hypothetical protein